MNEVEPMEFGHYELTVYECTLWRNAFWVFASQVVDATMNAGFWCFKNFYPAVFLPLFICLLFQVPVQLSYTAVVCSQPGRSMLLTALWLFFS